VQLETEVDEVIARHAKDRGYTADLKGDLIVMLNANPEGFRKMHPKPELPEKAALFAKQTPVVRREDVSTVLAEIGDETVGMTINRLMKPAAQGGKGMPYATAAAHANAIHGARH